MRDRKQTTVLRDAIQLVRERLSFPAVNRTREAAPSAQALLEATVDALPDYLWVADASLRETIYISAACEQLLGVPRKALLGDRRNLIRTVHAADRRRVYEARRVASGGTYDETYRIVRPDGSVRWVQDRAFPLRDRAGAICAIAGIAVDVTERKQADDELFSLAYADPLTGLPNRTLLFDRLSQAIVQAKRNQWVLAVLFIDVDKLKYVNDTFGHTTGDELLRKAARRLLGCMRSGDTVSRLGGDEFCVILSGVTAAGDAALVAQKILSVLQEPFEFGSTVAHVTASIGITLFPVHGTTADVLVASADLAMYSAKQSGGNRYQFSAPDMHLGAWQ